MSITLPKQFSTIVNPISIERLLERPLTKQKIVQVLKNETFGYAYPPIVSNISLPTGNWQKMILTIAGKLKGR
ncbi:hypothetical protein [Bacillus sp. SD088]|uniref:hypothetical protein n=1 Tax=Bacillus sp. SD088 TaxID=2782012 RepID=UPI001A9688F3|nr:hypothetical protein [Bacillus sp. SD088]MBO0995912.1 hypothetical protein [Bacillus sp. SD088]